MITSNIENDPKLLFAFKAGDKLAFNQVFNHFYARLNFFAESIIKDEIIAEDVVQEALIKAWQKKELFNSFPELKSFLYVVVRNACLNHLNSLKVKQKHQDSIQNEDFLDNQSILHSIIRAEVISRLFSVVDSLPEQCRRVMRMTFEEGKKPKEIADELGIAVSTVNNQKMRGLSLLKGKISKKDFFTLLLFTFLH